MRTGGLIGTAVLLTVALLLTGCETALGPLAAASVGSIVLIKRSPVDLMVSAVTGLDCSIVRLSANRSYCAPAEQPPAPPPYCTRSLAAVDCWTTPNPFGVYQREVADGPQGLTEEQESQRLARWPFR